MSLRGRLLFPMQADLARINTAATQAAGANGYDPDFRTFVPKGVGRQEQAIIRLPCQVEMGQWGKQNQLQAGNQPDSRLVLVFHFRTLEKLGLIDATGAATIRVDDRLVDLYDRKGLQLQMTPPIGANLFASEVAVGGVGLGGKRNLLIVTFEDRASGLTANP